MPKNKKINGIYLNRSSFALFVALLIHLLLLLIFMLLGTITPDIQKKEKTKENKIKVSLKEMPKKEKKSGEIKKKVKQEPIAPPMPKGKQLKKLVKKPPIKYDPKKIKEQIKPKQPQINKTEPKQKVIQKPKIKPVPPTEPYIPLKEKKPKIESFDPFTRLIQDNNTTKNKPIKKHSVNKYAWMSEDKSADEVKKDKKRIRSGSSINQNIKELYGDEFGELTPGQQKYIIDNQEIMRRITQEVLNRVARVNLSRDLNVNRTNVIEFYLHTNGDMSDFRFITKSGYYVLDDTTKETIEYSYSRYPRPSEKTLIRYNVFYNLARY